MAKPFDRQKDRLARRRNRYTAPTGRQGDEQGSRCQPGSMNAHKSAAKSGRRTRDTVKNDSRMACG